MDDLEQARIYGGSGDGTTKAKSAAWWAFAIFLYVGLAAFIVYVAADIVDLF